MPITICHLMLHIIAGKGQLRGTIMSEQLVRNYKSQVDWNIGCLFAHDDAILELLDSCKALNVELPIKYVFGSMPCVLTGGRISAKTAKDMDSAHLLFDEYNNRGVGVRLTFSSHVVEDNELEDETCNNLLSYLNNSRSDNGVIVSSDKVAEYIKKNYSNLQLIASQIKPSVEVGLGNDNVDYYNKLFDLYDIVVVNPYKVKDANFLEEIRHKDRVEFIANHHCVANCPMAKLHYDAVIKASKKLLSGENADKDLERLNNIIGRCITLKRQNPLNGTSFSFEEIEMLANMGYKHFKIEGRTFTEQTFLRDVGTYIFNIHLFTRLTHSMFGIEI